MHAAFSGSTTTTWPGAASQPATPSAMAAASPADPGLDERVCWKRVASSRYLIAKLSRYDAVSCHDVVNDRIFRINGRIGDEDAVVASRGRRRVDGVVVGAHHPDDLCALILDASRSGLRHAARQEYAGRSPREAGGGSHGQPMIAVAGGDEGWLPRRSGCEEVGDFHVRDPGERT